MDTLQLTQPDDWHVHLRDEEMLAAVAADTARTFARALVMPNLVPPVVRAEQVRAYRRRILAALPPELSHFQPLMSLYLTDEGAVDELDDDIAAVKLYPAGATTHSSFGVRDVTRCYPTFEKMAERGVPLLVHGEIIDPQVDIFDREKVFIEKILLPLTRAHPTLKVVLEHVTTQEGVDFVRQGYPQIGGTITAHHLMFDRSDLFAGGLRPHRYCLPLPKRRRHQLALLAAATSGHRGFFLGTDSAPHTRDKKEQDCGCAGCYTALGALELYAQIFEEAGALAHLEAFASFHGADFYGLPRNTKKIVIKRQSWTMPASLTIGTGQLIPLMAGQKIKWAQI